MGSDTRKALIEAQQVFLCKVYGIVSVAEICGPQSFEWSFYRHFRTKKKFSAPIWIKSSDKSNQRLRAAQSSQMTGCANLCALSMIFRK